MKTSEQLNELATALANAQAKLSTAKKDSQGFGYSYSDLSSVLATAKDVLAENGLSVSQLVGNTVDNKVSLTTLLMHKSGQFISQESNIDIPEMNKINSTQRAGAAISYLRRYALQAILGMASEDNDASTDSRPIPQANTSGLAAKVSGNNNSVSSGDITITVSAGDTAKISGGSANPPKMTDAEAKATVKAPSFSRNKKTTSSNDLGI